MKRPFFSFLLLLALTLDAFAAVVFTDNFESGNLNNWTITSGGAANALVIDNTRNIVPAGGSFSARADSLAQRMHRNLVADNGGVEISGHSIFTVYIYDDATALAAYGEVRGYNNGTGLPNGGTTPSGTLGLTMSIGKINAFSTPGEVFDATKYQARAQFGTSARWFNLNNPGTPGRSAGWHRFDIERLDDNMTVRFFVDGILGRTMTGISTQSWDTVLLGVGVASPAPGMSWYDGLSVLAIPDTNGPVLVRLEVCSSLMDLNLYFNEAVDGTAELLTSYDIAGLGVFGVSRITDRVIRLNTGTQIPGQVYQLSIMNVQDTAPMPNVINPNPTVSNFTAFSTSAKFYSDFCVQPPGTTLHGIATVENDVLKLTTNVLGMLGAIIIEDLDAGQPIGAFTASFKARVGGGTGTPADGFSFCFAPDLPDGTFGEEGAGTGLTVAFDSFNNAGGEAPAIDVKWGGNTVLHTNTPVSQGPTGSRLVDVWINLDQDGTIDVVYDGRVIYTNRPTFFSPIAGRFGLGARTGGLSDHHWIDDLSITTYPDTYPPTVTAVCGSFSLSEVTVIFSEPVDATAEQTGNYSLAGRPAGLDVLGVIRTHPRAVKLITSPQTSGRTYQLTVRDVLDTAPAPNPMPEPVTRSFRAFPPPKFSTDFNAGQPGGTQLFGDAIVDATGGIDDSGVLKLTQNVNALNGAFILDDLDAGQPVAAFTAFFRARVGGGSVPPADGFSFNFASNLPDDIFPVGEEGAGGGLIVSFDTFNNSAFGAVDEAPSVELRFRGRTFASNHATPLSTGDGYVEVFIKVDGDGTVDVIYGGYSVFQDVPAYTAKIAGRFGLAARTGGLNDNHWIDDLIISTLLDCGRLNIARAGNQITVTWTSDCTLQRADTVNGTYEDVPGNPVGTFSELIQPNGGFFRLIRR